MLELILAPLAAVSPAELLLIAAMALFASMVGGVAGYGTGALMPLVLVPMLGPEPVVPIIAISALFNNTWRALALQAADRLAARDAGRGAAPRRPASLSAYGYTLLTGKGAVIVIGGMLMLDRAAALAVQALRDGARQQGAGGRRRDLWRGRRRHRRRRRDPAVDPDGGGPAGRGRDRDRCGDLDRSSPRYAWRCSASPARSTPASSRSRC